MDQNEEQLWIGRAAAGDRAAMELLLDTYGGLLRHASCQSHLRTISEDARSVADLGFIEAVRRFDAGRGIPFAAYAKKMVYGSVRSFFRREQRRWNRELLPPGDDAPWDAVPDEEAARRLERADRKELLRSAICRLTDEERRLLGLLAHEGLSQRAIARRLGIPQQTVCYRSQKLLARLRRLLAD